MPQWWAGAQLPTLAEGCSGVKILLYGINFHPELTGTGKYSGEMADWLAAQGHEVDVVTAPPYYPQWRVAEGYSGKRFVREALAGSEGRVQILRCPLWVPKNVTGKSRLLHLATFAASSNFGLLWGLWRKPDLIFVVAPTLFQAPMAIFWSRLAGVPAWLHIQDFEVDAALEMGLVRGAQNRTGRVRRVAWAIETFVLRRFNWVSSISDAMVGKLHRKGVELDRVVHLPNWVSLDGIFPIPKSQTLRAELGIADDEVVVLYSGNMGEKQGLDLVVEAAELLKDHPKLRFVLAGTGSARARLEAAAAHLSNVMWLPLQPIEKLNALLGSADIHVLPQRADAADLVMPSKLTGMLASGRSIVGTAAPDTQLGRVLDQVGLRVEAGDSQALALGIKSLAGDAQRRDELGATGRQFAEQTLDKEAILTRFVATVQKEVLRR
jgi:colanic acid biosynthesis glycosyl transferase WcaI